MVELVKKDVGNGQGFEPSQGCIKKQNIIWTKKI